MAVPPTSTSPTTSSPPSYAPSKGKPTTGKGKGKGGKKGKGGQRPFFQKGNATQRASSAAAVCLRCGQSGHYSDQCPNPGSKSSTPTGSQSPHKKVKTTESYAYVVNSYYDAGGPSAFRGTLDNGASSVLIGHNTLMKNLKTLHDAGRNLQHLCFRPVDKTFHFGGDASRRSEWTVHLPVNVGGAFGRLQVFVIPGDTPFLLGRPILKHFKIQIDYAADKISIDGGNWTSTVKGKREEYLLDLHCPQDDWDQPWTFDLMTDETISNFTYEPDADTINLEEYLTTTQLPPPEFTFTTDDNFIELDPYNSQPQSSQQLHLDLEEDPTLIYKPITNKLLKTMAMHQHSQRVSRKRIVDRILHFYDRGVKQFWEVYAGQSNLSKAMSDLGYEITTLTSPQGGTLRRLIIAVSSFVFFARFALTSCGWPRLALCGAHCKIWLRELQNKNMPWNVKETIKNMFTWSSPIESLKNKVMRVEMLLWNNLAEHFPGRDLPSKECHSGDTLHKSINVPMEQFFPMSMGTFFLFENRPLCAWRALLWLKTWLGLAPEDIDISQLKEVPLELETVPKPQLHINLWCASTSPEQLTTTSTSNNSKLHM